MKALALIIPIAAVSLLTGCVITRGTVDNTTGSIVPMVILTDDGIEVRHDVPADVSLGITARSAAELKKYKTLRFLTADGTSLAELPLSEITRVVVFDGGIYQIDSTWSSRYINTRYVGSFTQFLREHENEVTSAKTTKPVYQRRE